MKLKELFVENRRKYLNLVRLRTGVKKENAKTCPVCQGECKVSVLEKNRYMCPDCGHLFPMPPKDRIRLICDANAFREIGKDLASKDPLNFPEYAAKRFKESIKAFMIVFDALGSNTVSTEWLTKLEKEHLIFPWMNFRMFSPKK